MIVRLYRPAGPEVAMLSLEPAPLLRIARAPTRRQLGAGTTITGDAATLAARFAAEVASLRTQGFQPAGLGFALAGLTAKSAAERARAARRLGRIGDPEAVDALIEAAGRATSDICAITDALGAIGDVRGLAVARAQAERKLLSRRRSGVEALRRIGDHASLVAALEQTRARLPEVVRQALDARDPASDNPADVAAVVAAVDAAPPADRGLSADSLYELGTPLAIAAAGAWLGATSLAQVWVWRYAKSVFKRALLRQDHRTLGWLAHRIEVEARARLGHPVVTAAVKSGLDGETRLTKIFSRQTTAYLRRAAWRELRSLARWRPLAYAPAAAAALVPYRPEDLSTPEGLEDELARCYLAHRILRGASKRWRVGRHSLRARFVSAKAAKAPPPGTREEPYPELWDAAPEAVVRLLAEAGLRRVHAFALAAAARSPAVLAAAGADDLVRFLDAPHEGTVELGLGELERRFDPRDPDWALIARLSVDARPAAAGLAQRWIKLTAATWTRDAARAAAFLTVPPAPVRMLAAELLASAIPGLPPATRADLAARLHAFLAAPEPAPEAHEAAGLVARALLAELDGRVPLAERLAWIDAGSPSAQAVGALLLERHPEAVTTLGLPRLVAIAEHPVALVRAAAARLVRAALPALREDPSLLFLMAESDWDDTRAAALALVEHDVDLGRLGIDGLVGLCDSTRTDVQDLGKRLIERHFATLDAREVASRLAEHPHPNMRAFALDLAERHLPQGFVALAKIEGLLRAILFDVRPSRPLKRRALELLATRGASDERQAELAAAILEDLVRTTVRGDFERVLEALARVRGA